MLIRKFPFIKKLHFIILCHFLVSNCWGSFLLENDEIRKTHKNMAVIIKNSYGTLPYTASDKFNNLCTASIQFVYKNDEETQVTKPEPILKDNKPIIASSSYTQDIYDENSIEISEILSWPFKNTGILRHKDDQNNFNKKGEPTKIYNKLFGGIKNHKKCYKALDVDWQQYSDLLNNLNQPTNPVFYLKNNYDYYQNIDFEDMKHSEPLIVWSIERNFEKLKSQCLEDIIKSKKNNQMKLDDIEIEEESNDKIEILYPIIHFHTRRQTCPDCENLIQKSARKYGYVPIISFSNLYLTEKNLLNSIPCKSSLNGGEEYIIPFSTFKNNFLDIDMLEQLKVYKKPRSKRFYLKKLYNVKEIEESIDKEFKKKTVEELMDLDNFLKKKKRLKGVKRFPLQFYTSMN